MTAPTIDTEVVPEPRWGIADVAVAFVVAQIASLIFFFVYAASQGLMDTAGRAAEQDLTIGEVALLQVPLWFGLLGVPLISTRIRGNGPRRDLGLTMRWKDAPIGFALGVGCQLVLVPLVMLPVLLFGDVDREALEAPARELTDKAHGAGVLVLALVVVVMAPLAEEVFFRGMLQRTLLRRFRAWPAMVMTAVFFSASHFQLLQFPALAAFGLVLSVLAQRTGRLGLNIWAHVGFNATTVLALVFGG